MRLGLDCKIVLLFLVIVVPAFAGDMFIGMRPYGATNIGTLQGTDSIPVDRIDASGNKKTTPADISSYVYSQINGLTAPAYHNHSTATSTRNGYQSSTDKGRFDALIDSSVPNSKTEGAVGTGTWTSLSTAGYTIATAQSTWPYLTTTGAIGSTHLITTSADLTAYGVDYAAIQNAIYKAVALKINHAYINSPTLSLERSIYVPNYFTLEGIGQPTVQPEESKLTSGSGLFITSAVSTASITVKNIKFLEAAKYSGVYPAGVYYGIKVLSSANNLTISGCTANNLHGLITNVTTLINASEIYSNYLYNTAHLLSLDSTTSIPAFLRIHDNYISMAQKSGNDYAIRLPAGMAFSFITNNKTQYQGLVYVNNASLLTFIGDNLIANNQIMGHTDWGHPYGIYYVNQDYYGSAIKNNTFWMGGADCMAIASNYLTISGNVIADSHSSGLVNLIYHSAKIIYQGNVGQINALNISTFPYSGQSTTNIYYNGNIWGDNPLGSIFGGALNANGNIFKTSY